MLSTGLSFFGEMLKLDDVILQLSLFNHIGRYPSEDIAWEAAAVLVIIAAAFAAIGAMSFSRRDLNLG